MKYAQYKYTPEEWEAKTGVNPRNFKGLINFHGEKELCYWSDKAEREYQGHGLQLIANNGLIGFIIRE